MKKPKMNREVHDVRAKEEQMRELPGRWQRLKVPVKKALLKCDRSHFKISLSSEEVKLSFHHSF